MATARMEGKKSERQGHLAGGDVDCGSREGRKRDFDIGNDCFSIATGAIFRSRSGVKWNDAGNLLFVHTVSPRTNETKGLTRSGSRSSPRLNWFNEMLRNLNAG